ncbi:MAG TPA: FlgO family outer membrane protein [Chthoniobacterales bacterium]|nr:FlgO family outer membrane protein [Chthoniobacterales bacterium]
MDTELEPDIQLEIAHVLFVDIVGYSKLLINEQRESVRELNEVFRNTDAFRVAEEAQKLICLPTGDGMALAFTSTPDAPVRCALQASKVLRRHPQLKIRMGVHSGPVSGITDLNDRSTIAGAGINIAQRVMDCGDSGHILLSKRVAEDLIQYRHWQPYLHDLGECQVKHGEVISLVNLYNEEVGNPELPQKLASNGRARHPLNTNSRWSAVRWVGITALVLIAAMGVGFWILSTRPTSKSSPSTPAADAAAPIPEKSIAVLPFENLSDNQETSFFTDGVQDEILSDLAKVADLKVISRTSVLQYKVPRARNLREIGRQLGVAHVVEGSVQRANNRIRVNAQLIDARTDAHLWAQTYDRDLADVFAIQSEIARTIADQLQAKLSTKEEAALNTKPTENVAAYDLYLQATQSGRNRASSIGSGGAEEAKHQIRLLTDAIAHDPDFLAAICLLAQNHLYLNWINADRSVDHLALAKQALARAERLQPDSPDVHLTRAVLHYWGAREYASALAELSIARRSLPNDTRVLFFISLIERRQNNWTAATHRMEQLLTLDPCNISVVAELAGTYGVLLRYPDAIKTLDRTLSWKPLDFNVGLLRADMDFLWKADLRRWRGVVESDATKSADADPKDVITARIDLALKERNYERADQLLETGGGNESDDNGFFTPREWKQAIVARALGQKAKAETKFQIARERAAEAVREFPDDAKALVVLGQIDAAMGRTSEALEEGQRAVTLLPVSKDALNGFQLQTRLIEIYAQAGEINRALDALEQGVHNPYAPEYGSLKLDQVWDPLRGNPRFEKLVAALAPR